MQRYFLKNQPEDKGIIRLFGDDYHHIVRVMRGTIGDQFSVVMPDGKTALCAISTISQESVEATIIALIEENRELPINVTIASGLLKGDKFDIVIQKGTELGAAAFLPFSSKRSIVKLDEKKGNKRTERWQKIAKEAAEQSERSQIPDCLHPVTFHDLLSMSSTFDKKIVAYEQLGRNNQQDAFVSMLNELNKGDSLLIVFGPEGGFSEDEIEKLEAKNFTLCGLGPRILRAETAPLYALSAISFYFELLR